MYSADNDPDAPAFGPVLDEVLPLLGFTVRYVPPPEPGCRCEAIVYEGCPVHDAPWPRVIPPEGTTDA